MLDGTAKPTGAITVFIAYSRRDATYLAELRTALALYERLGQLRIFADVLVEAGQAWERTILDRLEHAQIVILLLSMDFLSSSYCMDMELPRALARRQRGECEIIPISVRRSRYDKHPPLRDLLAIHGDHPVAEHTSRDVAWVEVTRELDKVITRMQHTLASVAPPIPPDDPPIVEKSRHHRGQPKPKAAVHRAAPPVPEPPPLLEILRSLTRGRLLRLARKVGAAPRGTKEQLAIAIAESTAGRRTLLSRLTVPELRQLCRRHRIAASSRTRKQRLILRLCWRVFVCHRSSVLGLAQELKHRLAPEEPICIDAKSLPGGTGMFRQLADAVDSALAYVIVVSNDFNSDRTLEELARAKKQHQQRGASIFPIYVEGPKSETPFGLASFPPIDGRDVESAAQVLAKVFAKLPR